MYTVAAQYLIYSDQTPQRIWVEGGVDLADVDGEEERGEHRGGPEGEVEEAARHSAVVEVNDPAHDRAQLRGGNKSAKSAMYVQGGPSGRIVGLGCL